MLRCIKVLFSFAKAQNYLPDEKNTAVEQMQQVRVKSEDTTLFSPEEMTKLLHHAPPFGLLPLQPRHSSGAAAVQQRWGRLQARHA